MYCIVPILKKLESNIDKQKIDGSAKDPFVTKNKHFLLKENDQDRVSIF